MYIYITGTALPRLVSALGGSPARTIRYLTKKSVNEQKIRFYTSHQSICIYIYISKSRFWSSESEYARLFKDKTIVTMVNLC